MRSEGSATAGNPFGGSTDLSPDYEWQSRGRRTEWGWQAEVRIPFKSLRYQSADVQRWSINVVRRVQHTAHEDSWAPARRDGASFLAQSGALAGLTGLRRGVVLDDGVAIDIVDGRHPVIEAMRAAHAALDSITLRDEDGRTAGWVSMRDMDGAELCDRCADRPARWR